MGAVAVKPIMRCQKCGGQLLEKDEDGNLRCLWCYTPHTEDGELIEGGEARDFNPANTPHLNYCPLGVEYPEDR